MRNNNEYRTRVITTTAAGQVRTSPVATADNARIQGSGITPSAKCIAVRDTDGLSTLLTDHLGSVLGDRPHVASPALAGGARVGYREERSDRRSWGLSSANCGYLVAESGSIDGLGALVGERRYLPFGEVHGDVGSKPAVDLSFTGQRALEGTGLIDYHARQYDPSLRVFTQPDTIIPEPYDVQDWNRYAYVHGNPVRFTDPSGNRICENGDCQINPYITKIQDEFSWVLDDTNMTTKLIQDILIAGRRIRSYVDDLTGGKGRNWMDRYMGNLSISVTDADRGSNWPADHITLPDYLKDEPADFNHYYIAHELGHVWDNSASPSGMGVYIGGGPSDLLNDFTGGEVSGSLHLRFYNPVPTRNDPFVKEPFKTNHYYGYAYGNGSTADYFADSFALNIFSRTEVPINASMWIKALIGSEAAYYFLN